MGDTGALLTPFQLNHQQTETMAHKSNGRKTQDHPWKTWLSGANADRMRNKLLQHRHYIEISDSDLKSVDEVEMKALLQHQDDDSIATNTNIGEEQIRDRLKCLTISQLQSYVRESKQELETGKTEWSTRRKTGAKKVTTWIQDFATKFDKFLAAFGPVCELAKAADDQYGGVAAVALTALFMVSSLARHPDVMVYNGLTIIVMSTCRPSKQRQQLTTQSFPQ